MLNRHQGVELISIITIFFGSLVKQFRCPCRTKGADKVRIYSILVVKVLCRGTGLRFPAKESNQWPQCISQVRVAAECLMNGMSEQTDTPFFVCNFLESITEIW